MGKDEGIVAKRRRWIERQIEAGRGGVDVRFEGLEPRGAGPSNRHGLPRVPVGQHTVTNWPVLDLGHQPDVDRAQWSLEIGGLVAKPLTLTFDELMALPQTEDVSDFHCVTTWSRLDNRWVGVRFADIMELAVPEPEARFVVTEGYDAEPGTGVPYTTNLSLERACEPDVLLVHTFEGEPLPREHGGPVRMITPRLYAWKGAKWIRRVELTAEDRKGYWELRGYSNTAEPWFDDRFSTTS